MGGGDAGAPPWSLLRRPADPLLQSNTPLLRLLVAGSQSADISLDLPCIRNSINPRVHDIWSNIHIIICIHQYVFTK